MIDITPPAHPSIHQAVPATAGERGEGVVITLARRAPAPVGKAFTNHSPLTGILNWILC